MWGIWPNVPKCPSTPSSDSTGKKINQLSLSIVKYISTLHCYFSHAYLSILSLLLHNIFLTEIISPHITGKKSPQWLSLERSNETYCLEKSFFIMYCGSQTFSDLSQFDSTFALINPHQPICGNHKQMNAYLQPNKNHFNQEIHKFFKYSNLAQLKLFKNYRINNVKVIFPFISRKRKWCIFLDFTAPLFKCALKANWHFFSWKKTMALTEPFFLQCHSPPDYIFQIKLIFLLCWHVNSLFLCC